MDRYELAEGLRGWSRGAYDVEAMVEILARALDGYWLGRDDFVEACVMIDNDHHSGGPWAWIDSEAALAYLASNPIASGGERRVLEVALSFGCGHRVDLGDALSGLSPSNTVAIMEAVAHLGGWHDGPERLSTTVDGTWATDPPERPGVEAMVAAFDRLNDDPS